MQRRTSPLAGPRCLDCRRAAGRAHYRANRAYYLAKARRRQPRVVQETRAWLLSYLREHPCVDCANSDIRVLEFDHRDGATKVRAIALLAGQGFSLARVQAEIESRVQAEIELCDVRCANCHRIRTPRPARMVGEGRGAGRVTSGRAREDSNLQPSDP